MYLTVADAALIEAAQRIAPLVRACRDEGERERRLPVQVLAAMHERCCPHRPSISLTLGAAKIPRPGARFR